MRFATIHTWAGPRVALYHLDHFIDLHASDPVLPPSLRLLLDAGPHLMSRVGLLLERNDLVRYQATDVRFCAPIPDPRKIICLGLNYRDHAAETGAPIPREPILFSKYPTALIGHDQTIFLPKISNEVDFEAELVIVIGKAGRHLSEKQALDHVAGYSIGHDVSARDWQLKKDGKQWMVGKTFDTFAPVGPFLVTADEVPNPQNLPIRLRLNGQTMQNGNTEQMIFDVAATLAHITQILTLEPGDLIFTGTPPGVGIARKPPVFLKDGDVVEIEIDGLGLLRNRVVQET